MLEKINHKSAPKEVINALISLYNKGELEQILNNYLNLTKIYKNCPEINSIFGAIYYQLDKLEKSIYYFHKGISLDPHNPNHHSDLGLVFFKIGKHESAIKSCKKAIKINKNFYQAYDNLGQINYFLKKYDDAISYYKKSLMINPKNDNAILQIGKILFDTDNDYKALTYFKKYFDTNPTCPEIITYIVTILYKIGEYRLAFNYIREGLNYYPNSEKLLKLYGTGLHIIGKHKFSIKYFQKILTIRKTDANALVNLIQLSGYDGSLKSSKLLSNFFKMNLKNSLIKSNQKIVCLLGFGRSGSLFLHSLLDGHPQISTLPGYFFKGWFSENTWPILQPNFEDINWRETLVEKICTHFEPQFNAHCKRNVIGEPNGNTEWFAKNLGFTQLGENHSEVLELDQQKFKSKFIDLSQKYDEMDSRICFELIHKAFDKAYRIPENSSQRDKIIFYHLHNPSYFERANFNYHYPDSKSLFIIRHPIQMLESWLLADLTYLPALLEENLSFSENYHFIKILNCGSKISHSLEYFLNPLNSIENVRGIKLEDLKRNPKKTLRKISEWIGIKDKSLLYQSTFMGKRFSRPSASFNNIEGFDTRSIDVSLGRIFGEKDIKILETLFWPFMDMHGYTKISKAQFLKNLKDIKPHLDKPFQFEEYIYEKLPEDKPDISKINQFNELHRELKNIWEILNKTKTYPNLIKPLVI